MPYYDDGTGRASRYYQAIAINNTVEAIAKVQQRILLVMATDTSKTYTAFQIIWRLWKSGTKKRILFLADRNILVDQTKNNDFKPLGAAMTKISKRQIDKSYEIYQSLYQAVTGGEEEQNIYKQFSPDFFDLIVIDECHRGSAADANQGTTHLATFRAIAKKYLHKPAADILRDLVASQRGSEGKWFAATKDAGLFDLAIELVNQSPTDPRTLVRAALDYAEQRPDFALSAGLTSSTCVERFTYYSARDCGGSF